MKAAIIAVGDELFAPGREETNSSFLTQRLASVGIPVAFRAVVGDEVDAIATTTEGALSRANVVFLTGGLGPTSDDITRDGVVRALGLPMTLDEEVLGTIEHRFERRGMTMPEVNRRQAMVPKGADVLPNQRGTAPGLWIPAGAGKTVILLPGPPAELRPVFERHVAPRLTSLKDGVFYDVHKLWVVGLPESSVEQRVASIYRAVENPTTTILASAGQVELRLTATGASADEAAQRNEQLAARLREALGDFVFSEAEKELEQVVGELLLSQGKRIAIAESLTGGLISSRITDVAGSSRYFDAGFITYSNEAKTEQLGVPAELFEGVGAVSEEVAHAMAAGARSRAGADIAVAVTGIAGPGGATETKPVGLVFVGLATDAGTAVERHQFPGGRKQVKRWTSQAALNMVRLELMKSI